jgi:hypothetical protein
MTTHDAVLPAAVLQRKAVVYVRQYMVAAICFGSAPVQTTLSIRPVMAERIHAELAAVLVIVTCFDRALELLV